MTQRHKAGDSYIMPDGTLVHAHPEPDGEDVCYGCVGDAPGRCGHLPLCEGIVWRTEPYTPPVTADTYKPAHGGYPGTVRLS